MVSETAPTQGTLKVFPDVLLANAYIILRPFFQPITSDSADAMDPKNWKFGQLCNPVVFNHAPETHDTLTKISRVPTSLGSTNVTLVSRALNLHPHLIPILSLKTP